MAMKKDLEFFFGLGSVAYAVSQSLSSMSQKGGIRPSELLKYKPYMLLRILRAKQKCKKENRPLKPKDLFHLKGFMVAGTDNWCYKDDLEELWGVRPMELFAGTEPSISGKHRNHHKYQDPWSGNRTCGNLILCKNTKNHPHHRRDHRCRRSHSQVAAPLCRGSDQIHT